MIKGIAASPGIIFAKAKIIKDVEIVIEKKIITNIEHEKDRYAQAIEKADGELKEVFFKALKEMGQDKAAIFEAHRMILADPDMHDKTIDCIVSEQVCAEFAFNKITDQYVLLFQTMEDAYLRERAADIKDVAERVIRHLMGIHKEDISQLNEDVILIADDLTPSDTAHMDKKNVKGFLTNIGGKTSHTAIMARSLEIPAVVGLKNITKQVQHGDLVLMDGATGIVHINPDCGTIKRFEVLKENYDKEVTLLKNYKGKESITQDGRKIELSANIGTPEDLHGVLNNDAEGIGLFRTEFLYMNRNQFPTEEEQFEAYKKVLEGMNGRPVIIRTLDIGGDKSLPYLPIEKEMNPFLGYRAIRICLADKDIFKTQLRALLRASIYGCLRIMFPMISCLEELLEAREVLEEVKQELKTENVQYSESIEVGMMIEVPSAAIISDVLAEYVDFFSIGTNDLIQYSCAVDRMNEKIEHLYTSYHPAILRLIKMVIENAHEAGKWVGMCGEACSDPKMVPILLGLGLDEFSMSAISILATRKIITDLTMDQAKQIAEKALKQKKAIDIQNLQLSI